MGRKYKRGILVKRQVGGGGALGRGKGGSKGQQNIKLIVRVELV